MFMFHVKLSKKMPWNEKVKLCNVSAAVRDTVRFRKAVSTFVFFLEVF